MSSREMSSGEKSSGEMSCQPFSRVKNFYDNSLDLSGNSDWCGQLCCIFVGTLSLYLRLRQPYRCWHTPFQIIHYPPSTFALMHLTDYVVSVSYKKDFKDVNLPRNIFKNNLSLAEDTFSMMKFYGNRGVYQG